MTPAVAIGIISQVLALSGLVSIRMFLSVFLYFLTMRLAIAHPGHMPEFILQMAKHTPEWQMSYAFLIVLGILAAAEIAAVRNPEIKSFLVEDFDRYAKPIVSALLSGGLATTAQALEVQELLGGAAKVQTASFIGFPLVMMIIAWCATNFCCRIRAVICRLVQAIDPGNGLGLQNLLNYLGELTLLLIFFVLVFLPILALLLTACGVLLGMAFKRLWASYEKSHSHPCPECAADGRETTVSDCALICPKCGAEQKDVRRVALFGFSGTRPLAGLPPERHAFRLLAAHRCRWCASPLDRSHTCGQCKREQWTKELKAFYVKQTDIRAGILFLAALSTFAFPVVSLLLMLIFFRPLVLSPLITHLGAGTRFLAAFLTMFLKLLLFFPLLFLSMIPGIGLLVLAPFIIRYIYVRNRFLAAQA